MVAGILRMNGKALRSVWSWILCNPGHVCDDGGKDANDKKSAGNENSDDDEKSIQVKLCWSAQIELENVVRIVRGDLTRSKLRHRRIVACLSVPVVSGPGVDMWRWKSCLMMVRI
jgi:hypothetical protein